MKRSSQDGIIPRLFVLRRVPTRYRQMLSLETIKRYQCVVIGGNRKMLTVAITNQHSTRIFQLLSRLTGYSIFPVLVEPTSMRLLIQRMDREKHSKYKTLSHLSPYHLHGLRSMLPLLTLTCER